MTIEEILAGESKNVEFKENVPEKSIKYMKSVVAFANGTGGKIIFGIADKTREVVGFDKEDVFKKMDAIENAEQTAKQFASNSHSTISKIISADQGQFSIDDRDANTPYIKRVRVVTTVTYALKD